MLESQVVFASLGLVRAPYSPLTHRLLIA
jgi:hypothetical protein